MTPCEVCSEPVPQAATGRPRKFCSTRCKSRRYYERHADSVQARAAIWRERNPDRVAALAEVRREAPGERDRKRAYNAAYYRANAARIARNNTRYRAEHPGAVARWSNARRVRMQGSPSPGVSARDWRRLVERYRGCCAYCGAAGPVQIDHVIPISRGGRDSIGNVLPACQSCNCSKRASLLVEWRYRRELTVRRRAS